MTEIKYCKEVPWWTTTTTGVLPTSRRNSSADEVDESKDAIITNLVGF